MKTYLLKTLTDEASGAEAEAWSALRLDINLKSNKAVLVEGGWKDGQFLADDKITSAPDRIWIEWNIDTILSTEDYETGTSIKDIVASELIKRMVSMDYLPKRLESDPDITNPFKGATLTPVPEPSE